MIKLAVAEATNKSSSRQFIHKGLISHVRYRADDGGMTMAYGQRSVWIMHM